MEQLDIFNFIDDYDYVPLYTFVLVTKNDFRTDCCYSVWIPFWNRKTNCYDSKCACCQRVKARFYPGQMCQSCGCTSNVYEIFAGGTSIENKCKYCIEQDVSLQHDFAVTVG